jgi:hypothetical protein
MTCACLCLCRCWKPDTCSFRGFCRQHSIIDREAVQGRTIQTSLCPRILVRCPSAAVQRPTLWHPRLSKPTSESYQTLKSRDPPSIFFLFVRNVRSLKDVIAFYTYYRFFLAHCCSFATSSSQHPAHEAKQLHVSLEHTGKETHCNHGRNGEH